MTARSDIPEPHGRGGHRRRDDGAPPLRHGPYGSTAARAPGESLVPVPHTLSEVTGPGWALRRSLSDDADLTRKSSGGREAIGQRIIIAGRVLGEDGLPT